MKAKSAPPGGGKTEWKKTGSRIAGMAIGVAVLAFFALSSYPGLLVALLVGGAFALLGVWIWENPRFGDLRTLFWSEERFAEMACERVDDGPPAALDFAIERAHEARIVCGSEGSLMDLAETDESIDLLIRRRQFDRSDLDRKLLALAWQDRRLAIESVVAAGANPNAVIEEQTAQTRAGPAGGPMTENLALAKGSPISYTPPSAPLLLRADPERLVELPGGTSKHSARA